MNPKDVLQHREFIESKKTVPNWNSMHHIHTMKQPSYDFWEPIDPKPSVQSTSVPRDSAAPFTSSYRYEFDYPEMIPYFEKELAMIPRTRKDHGPNNLTKSHTNRDNADPSSDSNPLHPICVTEDSPPLAKLILSRWNIKEQKQHGEREPEQYNADDDNNIWEDDNEMNNLELSLTRMSSTLCIQGSSSKINIIPILRRKDIEEVWRVSVMKQCLWDAVESKLHNLEDCGEWQAASPQIREWIMDVREKYYEIMGYNGYGNETSSLERDGGSFD